MNKVLVALNVVLLAAVIYLFIKISSTGNTTEKKDTKEEEKELPLPKKTTEQSASLPTGKFAYVNIDRLNEESAEVGDLVAETKRRKNMIESAVENLQMQYQKKIQEYQTSAKAGIAPPAELQAAERDIMRLEKEAQDKQLQMDNLSMEINEKNNQFQKSVRTFLQKWNNGRYDFILSYSEVVPSMLLGNASLEVTDEVIAEINKEYKLRKGKK
jgi:outer membrane protein